MVQRTVVELTDDLDGGPAEETIHFAFEGKSYAIDLSNKNADKLRKVIAPYVGSARHDSLVGHASTRRAATSVSGVDPKAVRVWAASNGYAVSARGRVGYDVVAAFKAAGN